MCVLECVRACVVREAHFLVAIDGVCVRLDIHAEGSVRRRVPVRTTLGRTRSVALRRSCTAAARRPPRQTVAHGGLPAADAAATATACADAGDATLHFADGVLHKLRVAAGVCADVGTEVLWTEVAAVLRLHRCRKIVVYRITRTRLQDPLQRTRAYCDEGEQDRGQHKQRQCEVLVLAPQVLNRVHQPARRRVHVNLIGGRRQHVAGHTDGGCVDGRPQEPLADGEVRVADDGDGREEEGGVVVRVQRATLRLYRLVFLTRPHYLYAVVELCRVVRAVGPCQPQVLAVVPLALERVHLHHAFPRLAVRLHRPPVQELQPGPQLSQGDQLRRSSVQAQCKKQRSGCFSKHRVVCPLRPSNEVQIL
eukprot:Rhum_TRINITY_DN10949_c0_g1::Rhum_TRINITY_DN10949_c0_g1_i1::g.41466::m.41466